MTKTNLYSLVVLTLIVMLVACKKGDHKHDASGNHIETTSETSSQHEDHGEADNHEHGHEESLKFTQAQIDALNIKIDTVSKRNMSGEIQVNGELGVPPQNEAIVTTTMGANIHSITVVEGDKVKKGEILAYISHPDIITLQTDYLQAKNKLIFLEQDYLRQKKLYDANVGSGRDYQQAKSAFLSTEGLVKGYESKLRLLGLSPKQIIAGNISQTAPVISAIDGFIEKVKVKTGQYVQPQTALFEVVNTEHIHLDLMVFEKDISKVKNGQLVRFRVEALGDKEMTAKIYAVGKSFEAGPKALHIHAEIENKDKNLIPGMYVNAQILTETKLEQALPDKAIFQEGDKHYVFTAKKDGNVGWHFSPQEVIVNYSSNGYTVFSFKNPIQDTALVAQSGAYYLMAEMKKSEAEHSH
ncbi:efflux RND transporter periplasmic adaptor subunit [Snuella sedimenti]|uniref:Efflux RND transporter periplasmic adaptor subunit n=1 Tax=Snuella sedimenti TaxID=2798802 RepID=A0A8J7LPA9_9FLAO|nr:efflux RND transporter periplasmic adaptor subunit [Snuella sedimenti]MBJ6369234.1 efflux RND transporter periplasmic adaptor subunit [Snuella sedimenti]